MNNLDFILLLNKFKKRRLKMKLDKKLNNYLYKNKSGDLFAKIGNKRNMISTDLRAKFKKLALKLTLLLPKIIKLLKLMSN